MDVLLILPPGANDAPVSYGTREFNIFKLDADDHRSEWAVRVPPDVATYFIHNAGFRLVGADAPVPAAAPEPVRMYHPDGHSCSWHGVHYPADEDGVVAVPPGSPADLMPHGFLPAPPKEFTALAPAPKAPHKAEPTKPEMAQAERSLAKAERDLADKHDPAGAKSAVPPKK